MKAHPALTWLAWVLGAAVMVLYVAHAHARDNGQWINTDQYIGAWFKSLMQPDNPTVPCCGTADAYWADSYEVDGSQYVAIITDTRDDAPLGRPHIAPGTKIKIPQNKMKYDKGNPTGHGIVFIGAGGVYCYLAPGGV